MEIQLILKKLHECFRKQKYKTKVDADLAIARIWEEKRRDLVKYGCKQCYGYHLTSGVWNDDGRQYTLNDIFKDCPWIE